MSLTCVVSTQLWHHIYCGGGLCDLPTWSRPTLDETGGSDSRATVELAGTV